MKPQIALSIYGIILAMPFALLAGLMAKDKKRKFWPWFFIGMVLPFMGYTIVFFLKQVNEKKISPVENENLFDHLFIDEINKKRAA